MILVFSKALQSVLGMYMIVIIIIIIMILIMIMIIIINFVIIIVIVIIIIIIIIIICVQVFASSVELKQRENPSAWNTALWQAVSQSTFDHCSSVFSLCLAFSLFVLVCLWF